MGRRWWIAGVAGFAAVALTALGLVRWRAEQALTRSEAQVADEDSLRFTVHEPRQANAGKFEWITSPAVYEQAAEFQGRLYLCGPAGLYEYGPDGKLAREFHPGNELPSSPLTRMTTAVLPGAGEVELVIATKSEGLLAFNGRRFRQVRPDDFGAREITAILPSASGQLLIGTSHRGVLIYDGKRLGPLHPTLSDTHVTELAGTPSDLWIGTIDRGVLHWHGGQTDAFSEAEGLPDLQVLSLYVSGSDAFVGTPLGVAEFREGKLERVVARGAFAQALGISGETLFIGTMDQGVAQVPLSARPNPGGLGHHTLEIPDVKQIFAASGGLYALSRQGLYEISERGAGNREVIQGSDAALTDSNISALKVDPNGALWVGYFDRGLDILGADGRRARHVENDRVFCVNRIVPLRADGTTAVATANGLALFDADGNERQVLTHEDGLIADHVTDVAASPDGMAVATPAGITFLGRGGARSLYAFQGLVNNHVYALAASGDEILAGTLGGITMLDRGEVAVSYTTANSRLTQNWISAVVLLGHEWMVGTYGGGILRLDESGRFHSYEVATDTFEVNPGAMLATERHVFAGSLDRGLFVYDRASDRWTNLTAGLPSENVTALAEGGGYIYIGTDNGLVRAREQDLQP